MLIFLSGNFVSSQKTNFKICDHFFIQKRKMIVIKEKEIFREIAYNHFNVENSFVKIVLNNSKIENDSIHRLTKNVLFELLKSFDVCSDNIVFDTLNMDQIDSLNGFLADIEIIRRKQKKFLKGNSKDSTLQSVEYSQRKKINLENRLSIKSEFDYLIEESAGKKVNILCDLSVPENTKYKMIRNKIHYVNSIAEEVGVSKFSICYSVNFEQMEKKQDMYFKIIRIDFNRVKCYSCYFQSGMNTY